MKVSRCSAVWEEKEQSDTGLYPYINITVQTDTGEADSWYYQGQTPMAFSKKRYTAVLVPPALVEAIRRKETKGLYLWCKAQGLPLPREVMVHVGAGMGVYNLIWEKDKKEN